MKLLRVLVISSVVVLTTSLPVRAEGLVLTADQIASIQGACNIAQQNLERLHSADKVLRVNLGQRYNDIHRRLMTPFISRAALNNIDTISLNTTSVQFRKELDIFSASSTNYQDSLHDAQAINCRERPVEFYTAIETARQNRQTVHSQTVKLNKLIDQFRAEVDDVRSKVPGASQ